MNWRLKAILAGTLVLISACGQPAPEDIPVIRTASFTFPALASVMAEIVQQQGFDRAHGFRLKSHPFGSVAAYYAALSRGEVHTAPGGPLVFQRMREQGIPVVITNTYASLASLVVIAHSPTVQNLQQLRGKTLAADMASSEYSILKLLAQRSGVDLGKDISVLQATPAVARAHLKTGEADAILTFEPTATLVLRDDPDNHVIFNGLQEWQRLEEGNGWLLVSLFYEPFARQHPSLVEAFQLAYSAAARWLHDHPEEADAIVSTRLNLDAGVLSQALNEGRIQIEIGSAGPQVKALRRMFEIGRELQFSQEIPPPEAIFLPVADREQTRDGS